MEAAKFGSCKTAFIGVLTIAAVLAALVSTGAYGDCMFSSSLALSLSLSRCSQKSWLHTENITWTHVYMHCFYAAGYARESPVPSSPTWQPEGYEKLVCRILGHGSTLQQCHEWCYGSYRRLVHSFNGFLCCCEVP